MTGCCVGTTGFLMTNAERDNRDRYSFIDGFLGNAAWPTAEKATIMKMNVMNLAMTIFFGIIRTLN